MALRILLGAHRVAGYTGSELYVLELARALTQRGAVVGIYCLFTGPLARQARRDGIEMFDASRMMAIRRFGADIFVVDMLGLLVLREIGMLLVAIMVAGRSGSAYTAELGSMKMREEIDALRTMGFDPIEVLVLPRMLALIIALPILAFLGAMAALYGGGLVAWLYGGIDPEAFLLRLRDAISIDTFIVGMVKAPVMAAVIGIVACVEGLAVEGSAESLGQHTTSSVVKSIFFVIVMDGVFAIFFASIGI